MYVNTKEACKKLGVCANTLRRWHRLGIIKAVRPDGGKGNRRYDLSSVEQTQRAKIIYARVSSNGQRNDLDSQIRYLRDRYPSHELIQDFGSGLNFKRKGLTTLLGRLLQGDVEEVVIAHRDRLCRFGFELFQQIAGKFDTRILVLEDTFLSPQEELVQDLLSIIHVFSCRLYGLRKYRDKIKKDPDLSKEGESSDSEEIFGFE